MTRRLPAAAVALLLLASIAEAQPRRVIVREVEGAEVPADTVEIRGVSAGPFDPAIWEAGRLHLLPDQRSPLLEPRSGAFRNIYAPSVVQTKTGWDIYYGAWDGVPSGNDRIYRTSTNDFLTFSDRQTVIEHGAFHHVCNVSVDRLTDGSLAMLCTTFPDAAGLNKPALFTSPDGRRWNGSPLPHAAKRDDVIDGIDGYDQYDNADINGMNVLLHEDDTLRMYFGNFRDFGKVYRASSTDGGRTFALDGVALEARAAVNDVKKFRLGDGTSRYLMGLHLNGGQLWYALSRDGRSFAERRVLATSLGKVDAYIVALGFVVAGEPEARGARLLGFLYGAGAVPSLDANRIFARWLQKRAVITVGDERFEPTRALGPDRQRLSLARAATVPLELYAEDGMTLIGRSDAVPFAPGRAYQIALD